MVFTCTKSGRSYFHKTARPEDKVYCPFTVVYQLYNKSKPFYYNNALYDDRFFFLMRYKSIHNHDLDTSLALSDLWQEVPQNVKAGKPQEVPLEKNAVQRAVKEFKLKVIQDNYLFETPCSNGVKFELTQQSSFSISMFKVSR